jgi:hypothetical protein
VTPAGLVLLCASLFRPGKRVEAEVRGTAATASGGAHACANGFTAWGRGARTRTRTRTRVFAAAEAGRRAGYAAGGGRRWWRGNRGRHAALPGIPGAAVPRRSPPPTRSCPPPTRSCPPSTRSCPPSTRSHTRRSKPAVHMTRFSKPAVQRPPLKARIHPAVEPAVTPPYPQSPRRTRSHPTSPPPGRPAARRRTANSEAVLELRAFRVAVGCVGRRERIVDVHGRVARSKVKGRRAR